MDIKRRNKNMDNYNKLFMIIRKTDLLNYDEKNELQLYLMNLKEQVKKQKEVIDKIYELIKQHIRKDEFLELNEWQTRNLLDLLKEVSE